MAGKNSVTLTFVGDSAKLERSFDKVGASSRQMETQVGQASAKTSGHFKAMGVAAFAAGAIAAGAMVKFGQSAIGAASDLAETQSKVKVLFGESADAIEAFAATAATKLGQSKQSALDAAATFATFGKGAGLSGDKLVGFSTKMTALASDMASFSNTSPEEAITAIGAALRGESEPIRKFGVLLDDATLRNEALKLGLITTTKQALTPQQRVLAAQSAILKQTTAAQGDFARTSDGVANKQRIMKAQMANTSAEIGTKLLPVMSKLQDIGLKVINFISKNIDVLGPLAGVIAAVVAVQWLWNIAMAANPIGLIIIGVAALAAGIIWVATKTQFFQTIWEGVWGFLKAIGAWFAGPFAGFFVNAWNFAVGNFQRGLEVIKGIPGKIGTAFKKVFGFITAPFRAAFNFVADAWNNTIGKMSWKVPGWVPVIGGNSISAPQLPKFHSGGVVPGAPGQEMVALLQAGERVTPAGAAQRIVLEIHASDSDTSDLLVRLLSRGVKVRGGDVQTVLGR